VWSGGDGAAFLAPFAGCYPGSLGVYVLGGRQYLVNLASVPVVGRRPFLALAGAAVVGLAGCLTRVVEGTSSRTVFDVDELPAGTRLDVDCDVGDVRLRGVPGPVARVVVLVEGSSAASVERIDAEVVHEEPAGVLRVHVRDRTPGASTPLPTVGVDVEVPPSLVVGSVVTRLGTVVAENVPGYPPVPGSLPA
jgi:hypothetical protein